MLDLHGAATRPRAVEVPVAGRIAGAAGEIFLAVGVMLLLYVGWELWGLTVQAEKHPEEVQQKLLDGFHEPAAPSQSPGEELAGDDEPDDALMDIPETEADPLDGNAAPASVDLVRVANATGEPGVSTLRLH